MSNDKRTQYENTDIIRYAERYRAEIDAFMDNEFQFMQPEPPKPRPQTTLFPEADLDKITKVKRKTKKPI